MSWERIQEEARRRFGVRRFRPGQRELIEAVLGGRDAIGVLPTGAGKSLCYQLPALFLPHATVVVSPLIALMQDQRERAAEAGVATARLDSTVRVADQRLEVKEIGRGERDLILVTPERLENPEYLRLLAKQGVSLLVVDEAHCVSQWGHDFRPAYLGLRDAARELGRPPILALTATATPQVVGDIQRQLGMERAHVVTGGTRRDNLIFEVTRCPTRADKHQALRALLDEEPGAGIVYVATVRQAEELTRWLQSSGRSVDRYHGKLRTAEREEIQSRFMDGRGGLVVATNAFGLGIDKPDIRLVVHWNFPDSLETYYQEAGRAGRDGQPARARLLYRIEDRRVQAFFLGGRYPTRAECLRGWDALRRLSASAGTAGVPLAEWAAGSGLKERRAKVIGALLENAGVAERRRGRVRAVRAFETDAELEQVLGAYDARHGSDRERLAAMMRYAQTALCRVRFLEDAFEEEPGPDCGRCDNCRARAQGVLQEALAPSAAEPPRPGLAAAPELAPPPFTEGEPVIHARFGSGTVVRVEEEKVTVAFVRGPERKVRAAYLRTAGPSAPQPPAPGAGP